MSKTKGNLPTEIFARVEVDGAEKFLIAGFSAMDAMPPEREKVKMGRYALVETFWAEPVLSITSIIKRKRRVSTDAE